MTPKDAQRRLDLLRFWDKHGLAYWLNRQVGKKHYVACPSVLIGASNYLELAVAAASALFGFESGAALAAVVCESKRP